MKPRDWSKDEVESIVDDYLSMLAADLAGVPYSKTTHRRALKGKLTQRSEQSIEFKHANISAALLDMGFPYISGYKPRSNYQALLAEVLLDRLVAERRLQELAAADVDRPIVVPEVDNILSSLTDKPTIRPTRPRTSESLPHRMTTNYIEREAYNRSLGEAGELFVMNFERARLIAAGKEQLASRIEHVSRTRGDAAGYDILSFDVDGRESLIEVKTTKYGIYTPFFISRNEVLTSERHALQYNLYRLFSFRRTPRLFVMHGSIRNSCDITASTFLARPR